MSKLLSLIIAAAFASLSIAPVAAQESPKSKLAQAMQKKKLEKKPTPAVKPVHAPKPVHAAKKPVHAAKMPVHASKPAHAGGKAMTLKKGAIKPQVPGKS